MLRVVLVQDVLRPGVVSDGHGELLGDKLQVRQRLVRQGVFEVRVPELVEAPDGCSAPGQGLDELHRIRWTERGARLEDLLAVDEEAHVPPETVLLIHDAEAETRPLPVEVGQQLSERGPAGLNLPLPGVREQRTRNHDLHAKTPVSTA